MYLTGLNATKLMRNELVFLLMFLFLGNNMDFIGQRIFNETNLLVDDKPHFFKNFVSNPQEIVSWNDIEQVKGSFLYSNPILALCMMNLAELSCSESGMRYPFRYSALER